MVAGVAMVALVKSEEQSAGFCGDFQSRFPASEAERTPATPSGLENNGVEEEVQC